MNVTTKKLLALLTALVLAVSLAGCLEKTPAADDALTAGPTADADAVSDAADIDYTAAAIEVGDTTITVQDISDVFNDYLSYMEYYGQELDAATALQYAEESCLATFVPIWQAGLQGVTLTDEELAKVDEDVALYRQEVMDQYISYAQEQGGRDGTDWEAYALELINADLSSSYGTDFDQYMVTYHDYQQKAAVIEKVQSVFNETVSVTDEEIMTWYDTTLKEQTDTFAGSPADFESVVIDFESGASDIPALITPNGFVRVKLIQISPEGALDAAYTENATTMSALEAEYGALALNGNDAARLAEIKTEYASLLMKNEAFYEAYTITARETAAAAKAALDGGTAFEDVMREYSVTDPTEAELASGELLYAAEALDDVDAALTEAIAELSDGAYSDVLKIGDDYYIVQLVGTVASGITALEDCKELCAAAALADKQESEWTAINETWLQEAKEIAVYHKDAYAALAQ